MIAACRKANVKSMIAYRLHFETINLAAIELARRGRLGELKFFNSSFSMTVRRGDIRTKRAYGGGTLYDIGVYCINAARNLFRSEPTQVSAVSINSGLASLAEIDETTAGHCGLVTIEWRRSSPVSTPLTSPHIAWSERKATCTSIRHTNRRRVVVHPDGRR